MKKAAVSISAGVTIAIVLLFRCSTQQQKAEHDKGSEAVKVGIQIFSDVDAKAKIQFNAVLADYFVLNQMLIADNQAGTKEAAQKLSETVKKFDKANLTGEQMDFYLTQISTLSQGLQEIRESSDIEKSRLGLATVSESLYTIIKAYHPNQSPLYYQYCPMARNGAGASWLSETQEIVNPYMGQMMPKCGRNQETLP